jgi:hypothetical protein
VIIEWLKSPTLPVTATAIMIRLRVSRRHGT